MAERNHHNDNNDNECECSMANDIQSLKAHVFGNDATKTPGLWPTVFGDGDGKAGIVGNQREVSWKLNLIIAGIVMIVGALVLAFANGLYRAATAPTQNVSQTVGTGDGATPATEYDSKQVASMLGYSIREIQDRAAKGEIPGARKDGKEWRFNRAAVDAALAAKAVKDASAVDAAK